MTREFVVFVDVCLVDVCEFFVCDDSCFFVICIDCGECGVV